MKPYVHRCTSCLREWATWSKDELPRGWKRLSPLRVACRRCARSLRARVGSPEGER